MTGNGVRGVPNIPPYATRQALLTVPRREGSDGL